MGTRTEQPRMAFIHRFALRCGVVVLLGGSGCAMAETVLSRLTIDGELLSSSAVTESPQKRIGFSESGRPIVIDEYALVRFGANGDELSFATPAFAVPPSDIVDRQIAGAGQGGTTRIKNGSAPGNFQSGHDLLIQHQDTHPANDLFTPTPNVTFVPQMVSADSVEGLRGYAIVDVGESGRVLRVKLLAGNGEFRNRVLQSAIAQGIESDFVDDRRHGHTVYMVYEVRGQTVNQVGSSLVTLPMCGCQ